MPPLLTIDASLAGQTLAAAVRHALPGLSWSDARKLIAARRAQINGVPCLDDARRLKLGETVAIVNESSAQHGPASAEIVYADADLVVVDKPAGLQTVRRNEERHWSSERKSRQPVLEELVQELLSRAGSVSNDRNAERRRRGGNAPIRVRPVHRLDRDTSGLMLFALSPEAEQELVRRFAAHAIHREYRAVVHGTITDPRTIESWLVRDRGDGLRGSLPGGLSPAGPPAEAQRAVTHLWPIEPIGAAYTLIGCRLETGRTHQIRVHLAEIGHMLCGEKTYLSPRPGEAPTPDQSHAPCQALHSAELQFEHPISGTPMKFQSPWPTQMQRWMQKLRQTP